MPVFLGTFRSSELFLLFLAASAIAVLARRRGGNPVLWGALAFLGAALIKLVIVKAGLFEGPGFQDGSGSNTARLLFPIAWLAGMALVARFILGRRRGPGESWFCPACQTHNPSDASNCGGCGRPYETPPEAGG